jgi:hypothetical protein
MAAHFQHEINPVSVEERRRQRRNILRAIIAKASDVQEQERLYEQQTGMKHADFFRRKHEINSGDFDAADAAQ